MMIPLDSFEDVGIPLGFRTTEATGIPEQRDCLFHTIDYK